MRVGQHVHLKFHPETHGTISSIEPHRFQVTWPAFGQRGRTNPRLRFWYPLDALSTGLKLGLPVTELCPPRKSTSSSTT